MTKAAHYPGIPAPAPAKSLVRAAALLLIVLLGTACGAGGGKSSVRSERADVAAAPWAVVPSNDPAAANAVLMRAISLVGTPYRFGGNTPSGGFDCSGLVNYVYQDMLALKLPRSSSALAGYQGPKISARHLAAADLVFFGSGGNVSHVGIYIGDGRFVHAPSTGGTVRLDHLDGHYWRDHYSGAKRVIR